MKAPLRSALGVTALVGLCALPAHGFEAPSLDVVHMLTPIDTVPTKEVVRSLLQSSNEVAQLLQYATGPNIDFGVRLRAVRAIPHFCSEQPIACHDALLAVIASADASSDTPGQKILRRRAAIEALGIARSGLPSDVTLLANFLDNASRDIRVAAVRALRDICDPAAIEPLERQRDAQNEVPQVIGAINEALDAIAQCGP